jgi:hypothetical protein
MPVEPLSYVTIGLLGMMVLINLWILIEPKWDTWRDERRRQGRQQATVRITPAAFEDFMKIAGWLHREITAHNDSILTWTRIHSLLVVYRGYPTLFVPTTDYVIPYNYGSRTDRSTIHIKSVVNHQNDVIGFQILAMSGQTNEELLDVMRGLPAVEVTPVAL